METNMTYPEFYDSQNVGSLYTPNISEVISIGHRALLQPSETDDTKVALLLIDAQVDFIHENGALSVAGAVDDTRRTIEWMFRNLGNITKIYASLDSHLPNQIFSPSWWVDANGHHPQPFTLITHDEVKSGKWKALYQPKWSLEYTERLEENAKKQLMVWPYHTLIGTSGHNITPALYEAILYHSSARQTQPEFIIKGTVPNTEHYSIFEPEVKPDGHADTLINTALLDELAGYDKIYVAGQAKSHCVLESVSSMMRYYEKQPETINKIHILQDAMSSVASPVIDFDQLADDTFQQFAKAGLNLVSTVDSLK